MSNLPPVLYSISDVCQQLGVCRATLWKMEKLGQLPEPVRLGSRIKRWRVVDIEAFLAAGGVRQGHRPGR